MRRIRHWPISDISPATKPSPTRSPTGTCAISSSVCGAQEIIPVTSIPQGTDALAYVDALMRRYSNTEIRHRTWQIAMDGSQKLPQRILQTVRERLNRNLSIAHLALVVAAWIRYVRGIDEAGKAIDVRDPFAADLKAAIGRASSSAGEVRAALGLRRDFRGFIERRPICGRRHCGLRTVAK